MMGRWREAAVAAVLSGGLWAGFWSGAASAQAPTPQAPAAPASAPASSPAPGQEFTVTEVEIDRSGATGTAARDAAIAEAQRTAFRRLVERLVPRERLAALPRVSDGQISDMIDHFEIQRERISGTRYAASFTVAFRPEAVQAYLGRGDPTQAAVTPAPGSAPGAAVPGAAVPGAAAPGASTPGAAPGAPGAPAAAGPEQRYTVRVALRTMADLVRVQRQLEAVPGLRRAEQTSLSLDEATFDLTFAGNEAALRDALARQDLTLGRDPQGLTLAARTAAPR
jgi:hypothetical protein